MSIRSALLAFAGLLALASSATAGDPPAILTQNAATGTISIQPPCATQAACAAAAQNPIGMNGPSGFRPRLPISTVAALPNCSTAIAGTLAVVSDAASPVTNAGLTGGGAITALALCTGSAWTAH